MNKVCLIIVFLVSGCGHMEYSGLLVEPATVVNTIYTPATHGTGVGISGGGNAVFTSVDTRPVWGAVFQCQHGNFVVTGEDEEYKNLFLQLRPGQMVSIGYREIYWINGDQRTLEGYDFLNAIPIGEKR